jgi:hypothetical protein
VIFLLTSLSVIIQNLLVGENMKKVIIGSVIMAAMVAFSGCSTKNACKPAPKLPTCASACAPVPAPAPCGCAK